MHRVIIKTAIEAAHRLFLPYESKCNNQHGHTYNIEVEIESPTLNEQGMVIDFTHVKGVIRMYDHQYLNDYFEPTTAEVFAHRLGVEIQDRITKGRHGNEHAIVIRVSVSETPGGIATWLAN